MAHKILLLGPPSPFYEAMLRGLSQGFTDLGHEAAWQTELPTHESVASFVKRKGVSLVFEINRTLSRDQPWPSGVAHAAWLQDHWIDGNLVVDLGKSDHIYFLYHPDAAYAGDLPADCKWSILSPGARADAPAPTAAADRYDLAFCGHLPSPPDMEGQIAISRNGRAVSLSKFLQNWPPEILSQSQFCLRAIREKILSRCREVRCQLTTETCQTIDETMMRTIERRHILNVALTVSSNIGIWGPDKWQKWPEFAPFYKGDLPQLSLDKEVYQAARINVHTGTVAMHVRSMDCMAAGGFLLINRTWIDDKVGGINHFFAADEHYGSYDMDDFGEVACRYLEDAPARARIAAEGRRAVLAAHTWKHRAEQILKDFS